MSRPVHLVTGASAGIGLATATELARRDATVVLLCRDPARGAAALDRVARASGNQRVHLVTADLASQRQVREAAGELLARFPRLDVLINNAAVYRPQRTVTEDGIETQLAVNYLSYFLLTCLLLERLRECAPSRVVNLTTINHRQVTLDLDDLQSERSYEAKAVHMRGKLAVILFTYELARRLQGTGVTANCVHPGVIATNLLGQVRNVPEDQRFTAAMGGDPVDVGAATPVRLATAPKLAAVTGCYFEDGDPVRSSPETYDREKAAELWRRSEELCSVKGPSAERRE